MKQNPSNARQLAAISERLEAKIVARCKSPKTTAGVEHTETLEAGITDDMEIVDYLFDAGWRVVRGSLFCPACVEWDLKRRS